MKYKFYTGSYGKVGEDGIALFYMDTEAGTLEKVYANQEVLNPSYLGFNSDKTVMYAVQEEVPVGRVHALTLKDEKLKDVCSFSTDGADPCHVSLDRENRVMFVDNYTSGSLAVYKIGPDGMILGMTDFIQHEGKGPNPVRQECAHVHYTKEHNGQAFVVDLGMDRVFIYDVDFETGKLTDTGKSLNFPGGYGPRHLEFHRKNPDIIYAACELGNKVMVFMKNEKGDYESKQCLDTLPEGFTGATKAAAIKMQNDMLFVSNRGDDSIAAYRVGADGLLTLTDIAKTGGETPRDFTLFGDYIVIANQDSDSITVLKVNWETGKLEATGMKAETVKPTCIRKY